MSVSIDQLTFNQVVTGSNPVGPTNKIKHLAQIALGAFLFKSHISRTAALLVDRFSRVTSIIKEGNDR